jgi:NADH:ubiquinone oxidoreductase subunit 6 (subunit J)
MFIEYFIFFILFVLFFSLIKVRSTLKLLIITILLFLTCSALLMLKGFIIISCIFILVYAGAILVMICIAFVLSPIIETKKIKSIKEKETVYFEISTEIIQYLCGGFMIIILVLLWCVTANPLNFLDIIGEFFVKTADIRRSANYIKVSEGISLRSYDYYLNILDYYCIRNKDHVLQHYNNNLNYLMDVYTNKIEIYNEESFYLLEQILIKNIFLENKTAEMEYSKKKMEIFCRYYLENNESLAKNYINDDEVVMAKTFLFKSLQLDLNSQQIYKLPANQEEFNILPKELLFCSLTNNFIKEIVTSILFLDYKNLDHGDNLANLSAKYENVFKTFVEQQIGLELYITNIKKMFDIEIVNYINNLKVDTDFKFIAFANDLRPSTENLKSNQVLSIFKYSKYIIVLVGLYLHFTLLVCLRIFTINQQLVSIKRQDSNDQILKKWKK